MKKSSVAVEKQKDNSVFLGILKGSLLALTFSLLGVLIFAFVLRFVPLADSVISPVNQVIKGVSILLGTLFGLKKTKEMGLISGLLIGFFYTALAFLTFSILDGQFKFSTVVLNDLLFGAIIGAICGIIAVNIRRKK
jgi:putative membrane protein (TIGR04086 family)